MQNIFRRYENKYFITQMQHADLDRALQQYMERDCFGEYLVQNLYYDTNEWDVIRISIEKPFYKEKMRLRCYGSMKQESNLFLELKKKYNGVVYKRRMAIPATALSNNQSVRNIVSNGNSQIARELDFYLNANMVSEKMYISYRRTAFVGIADEGLRITFDTNIRFRLDRLNYSYPGEGRAVLPHGMVLMEIKTLGGIPLWLAHALCENGVFPTAFSKYGACYADTINQMQTGRYS